MAQAKQTSKRKRRKMTLPAMGAAGVSLALTGGASAAPAPVMDDASKAYLPSHEITLGEEEISDVSLATFYVFDNERQKSLQGNIQVARACGGCGGGGRCGGGGGRCGGGGIGRCGGGGCAFSRCGGGRCFAGRCGFRRCGGFGGCGGCGGCGGFGFGLGIGCSCGGCCSCW
jgi:hypothetical protein